MPVPPTLSLQNWLRPAVTPSADGKYWHLELKEDGGERATALPGLKSYVQHAHEDARRRLRALAAISLDPLHQEAHRDPAFGYPWMLDLVTLQGYLGEVFAGLVAEGFGALGSKSWEVPAFLFRFHDCAFDALERWQQMGPPPGRIPGRTGNDCVAFERDSKGEIARILVCEAKCTLDHSADLIHDAHVALSDPASRSVSILKLVDILRDRGDAAAHEWIGALLQFRDSTRAPERCDLVAYLCGRSPSRKPTWIPTSAAAAAYKGGRRLGAVEVHLLDVVDLISQIYRQPADWNGTIS